jgi:hypothetical protein
MNERLIEIQKQKEMRNELQFKIPRINRATNKTEYAMCLLKLRECNYRIAMLEEALKDNT